MYQGLYTTSAGPSHDFLEWLSLLPYGLGLQNQLISSPAPGFSVANSRYQLSQKFKFYFPYDNLAVFHDFTS